MRYLKLALEKLPEISVDRTRFWCPRPAHIWNEIFQGWGRKKVSHNGKKSVLEMKSLGSSHGFAAEYLRDLGEGM